MAVAKRRTVLMGAGAAGVSVAVAACGEDGGDTAAPDETTSAQPAESPTADGGSALASLSDVPEGGGIVLGDQKVVLTQPTKGEIKGFSSVCTHKGCKLASVKDGTINCDCHGSKFDMADGSVRNGPATTKLPEVDVKLEGDEIVRA